MKPLRTIAVLACIGTLAACSSSGDDAGSSNSPSGTPTASAAPTSDPTSAAGSTAGSTGGSGSTGTPGSSGASGPSAGGLQRALLTPAEVGTGFAASADQSSGDATLPCTPKAAPLFTQVPPNEKANRNFESASAGVTFSEDVAGYADQTGAAKAFQIGSTGFACSTGTLSGKAVKIVRRPLPTQPAGSPLDAVAAWDFGTGQIKGTAVLLQVGSKIVGLTFAAGQSGGKGVDVGAITDKAGSKVLRAG